MSDPLADVLDGAALGLKAFGKLLLGLIVLALVLAIAVTPAGGITGTDAGHKPPPPTPPATTAPQHAPVYGASSE